MILQYEEIYSQFYLNMTDPLFYKQSEDAAYSKMKSWLHNATAVPYIKKIFSSITLNDELSSMTCVLHNSTSQGESTDDCDKDFVISIFAQYMVIAWMKPTVDSVVNISPVLGTKEEKRLQSNYKITIERLHELENSLRKMIRDHGYINNDYLESVEKG